MATESSLSKQISDITTCSICLATFKEPKLLPCIHTFCLECLNTFCKNNIPGSKVPCPLCRQPFLMPHGGMIDLTTNFFINQLLQVNQSEAQVVDAHSTAPLCELCSELSVETKATAYCAECNQMFCDRCTLIHRKQKITKSHEIWNATDSRALPNSEERIKRAITYCEIHPKEEIKLYCDDCNTITCFLCYLEIHKKHECTDIEKSAENFRVQLESDIEKVVTCTCESRKRLEEVEMKKNHFIEKIINTEKEIAIKYDDLIALIKTHQSQLTEDLHSLKEKALKDMETRSDELERDIVITESYTRYCQQMKEKGTAYDISRAANDLHVRAVELVKNHELHKDKEFVQANFVFTPILDTSFNAQNLIGKLVFEDNSIVKKASSDAFAIEKPTLNHVMRTNGPVYGLTVLGSYLYVIQDPSSREGRKRNSSMVGVVDVYSDRSFNWKNLLDIPGAHSLQAILSQCRDGFLYFSDVAQKKIYRCEIETEDIIYFSISEPSWGLSVTESYNLLVTLHNAGEIQEYTPDGECIRTVRVEKSCNNINQSIQVALDHFIVSYADFKGNQSGVAIIDKNGRIIKSYGGHSGSGVGQMRIPTQMATDRHGFVMIFDYFNGRVELLSPLLTHIGYIEMPRSDKLRSYSLHLDERSHRLYIGLNRDIHIALISVKTSQS